MEEGKPTVPTIEAYLRSNLPAGSTVGIDGMLFSINATRDLRDQLAASGISLRVDFHPADTLWSCLLYTSGGRHTPFHNHYRPQFYIRTLDVTGEITLPEGVEMVMPGDHVEITVELINPVACDQGLRFAIREGGRTVGSGQITEILD